MDKMVETGAPSRLSVNQVRLILGFIAFVLIIGAVWITLQKKTLISDFNAPTCGGNTCTETLTSSDAIPAGGGYGGTYGPLTSTQYATGRGQYALGGGGVTDNPAPNGGCDGSGDHYDGNFWGLRGQTAAFATNPVWWYSPPTATGGTLQCKNTWGKNENPVDTHEAYNVLYGAPDTDNDRSVNIDPAAFLDPAGGNGNSGLGPGFASDPDYTAGKATWPGALKANNVDTGTPATSTWSNGANYITCGSCNDSSDGQTFVYRVTFDTLDPATWNITGVTLRYDGSPSSWAAAWIDSTGNMTTDTGANKTSDEGNETPFPCQNDGACPILYNNVSGNLAGPDGAGRQLELGQGQTDCSGARCGDLPTILSQGTRHVLAIQASAKSYACAFNQNTGCHAVNNIPAAAFWLQITYAKKPPAPTINVLKSVTVANPVPGQPNAAQPGSTLSYTVKITAAGSAGSFPYSYNLSDVFTPPTAGCLAYQGNGKVSGAGGASQAFNPGGTLKRTFSAAGTDTLTMSYIANSTGTVCPDGSSIKNTGTATFDSGSQSSTVQTPFFIAYNPFIVTKYGDVHSNAGITTNPGSVATYIVSAKNTISNFNSSACLIFYSTNGCNAQGGGYGTLAWPWDENPSFFNNLNNPGILGVTAQGLGATTSGDIGPGFFVYNGSNLTLSNLRIHGATTIYASNPSAQITINGGITAVSGSNQSTIPALFIISGGTQSSGQSCAGSKIIIDNGVTNIQDTTLFTAGTIQTADQQTSNVLTMTGALIGCKIDLTNRIGQDSSSPPAAEEYDYIGNFILNPPPGMLNIGQTVGTLFYTGQGLPRL
jgi:hypothetical protein